MVCDNNELISNAERVCMRFQIIRGWQHSDNISSKTYISLMRTQFLRENCTIKKSICVMIVYRLACEKSGNECFVRCEIIELFFDVRDESVAVKS